MKPIVMWIFAIQPIFKKNLNMPDPSKALTIQPWKWILLFGILQISVAMLTYNMSLSFDESIWYYIGRNWFRNGLVPYQGGVDNKSPLIFIIFGISDKFSGTNEWIPRIMGTVVQCLGLYYVYKMGNYLSGGKSGWIAMTIYGLTLLWPASGGKYASYTETYSVAAIVLAYYIYLISKSRSQYFLAGIFAGLGIAFRISAVFAVVALGLTAILNRPRVSLQLIGGIGLSIFLFLLLLSLAGVNLREFLVYGIKDNFGSGSPTDHTWRWKLDNFSHHFIFSAFILFFPLLVAWFFLPARPPILFYWLLSSFVGIHFIGIYSNQHFKELLPSLALISAFVFSYFGDKWQFSHKAMLVSIWILFTPKTIEPFIAFRNIFQKKPLEPDKYCRDPKLIVNDQAKKELGLWIRAKTGNEEKVLVAGYGALVQAYAERVAPSIYFNATQTGIAISRFCTDLSQAKPALVAVPVSEEYRLMVSQNIRTAIEQLINRNYVFERCAYGYNIYRIRNIY
ncbi:MAG: ArnT family glycosyltransferase [Chitinophagales bacterium]